MILIDAYSKEDDGFPIEEHFQFRHPGHCPFGHLEFKWYFILRRLNYLNETVTEIYKIYEGEFDKRKLRIPSEAHEYYKFFALTMRFSSEIKILTDEIICLNFLLKYFNENSSWPSEISIDCIGSYISLENKGGYEPFTNSQKLIEQINDLGNAVKHTFINTNIIWLKMNDRIPRLSAFLMKNNKIKNETKFYSIPLLEFINNYNFFLKEFRSHLRLNY